MDPIEHRERWTYPTYVRNLAEPVGLYEKHHARFLKFAQKVFLFEILERKGRGTGMAFPKNVRK